MGSGVGAFVYSPNDVSWATKMTIIECNFNNDDAGGKPSGIQLDWHANSGLTMDKCCLQWDFKGSGDEATLYVARGTSVLLTSTEFHFTISFH
jgi:hypothetical protein